MKKLLSFFLSASILLSCTLMPETAVDYEFELF